MKATWVVVLMGLLGFLGNLASILSYWNSVAKDPIKMAIIAKRLEIVGLVAEIEMELVTLNLDAKKLSTKTKKFLDWTIDDPLDDGPWLAHEVIIEIIDRYAQYIPADRRGRYLEEADENLHEARKYQNSREDEIREKFYEAISERSDQIRAAITEWDDISAVVTEHVGIIKKFIAGKASMSDIRSNLVILQKVTDRRISDEKNLPKIFEKIRLLNSACAQLDALVRYQTEESSPS
jgi:hypothetical protein